MKIGVMDINKVYAGNNEVKKIYQGSTLVYTKPSQTYDAEVEYIEFSSIQTWIKTNIIPVQNDVRTIVDAQVTAGGDNFIFGMYDNTPRFNLNWYNYTQIYFRFRDINTSFTTNSNRHIFEIGSNFIVDGNIKATPTFSDSNTFINNTKKVVIGGRANAAEPTAITYPFRGKIYSFKMYYGDTLVFDGIPVRKNGGGCLYDSVTGTLFENAGTETITYGNDVV